MKHILLILLTLTSISSFSHERPNEHDLKLVGKLEYNKIELGQRLSKQTFETFLVTLFEDGGSLVVLDTVESLSAWFTENEKVTLVFAGGEGLKLSYSLVTDDMLIVMKGKTVLSFKRVKSKLRRERESIMKK